MQVIAKAVSSSSKSLGGAQSVLRAIALIRSVAKQNENGARLSAIARDANLNVSTAHRILSMLAIEGFITHDRVSKCYHLGIELYRLGMAAHQYFIRDRFRGALKKIERETGDTVFLLIRTGNDALCIDRVEGTHPIRTVPIDIGSRRPLGVGAGSLSLVAFLSENEFTSVLTVNATRYPQYKNLSANRIKQLAKDSRAVGYVVSEGLFHEGVTSLGIPVFDQQGIVVASIVVSSTCARMTRKRRSEIYRLVKEIIKIEGFICKTVQVIGKS